MDDEWVRQRAFNIHACPDPIKRMDAIAAFGHEAITRTREAERALAAEALRAALAKQEKAVAAERERLLNRLKNPDEAMVVAMRRELGIEAHQVTVARICRALAATLEEELRYLTIEEQNLMDEALRKSGKVIAVAKPPRPTPDAAEE